MEIGKLEKILDSVLFGVETGDGVVTFKNHKYHVSRNQKKPKGLIEKLQIGFNSNLGINMIVAKKLKDGIIEGIKDYIEKEQLVDDNLKKVAKEDKETTEENEKLVSIMEDIAEQTEKTAKKKKK